jgi:hypothetical protein
LATQNAFAKSGVAAKLGGSGDDKASAALKAILAQPGCQWEGSPCDFYTWRAKYLESQGNPQRAYDIHEVIGMLENPYSRADRERQARALAKQAEGQCDGDDIEGAPCAAEEQGCPPDPLMDLGVGAEPTQVGANAAEDRENPQRVSLVEANPGGSKGADGAEAREEGAAGSAAQEPSRELIKEKYGVSAKKLLPEAGGQLGGDGKIDGATKLLEGLRHVDIADRPAAELALLEQLAAEFKTPSIASQLRSLCAAQRKVAGSASAALEAKIAKRVAEQEAQEAVALGASSG